MVKSLKKYALVSVGFCYIFLIGLVVVGFDNDLMLEVLLFLFLNFVFSSIYLFSISESKEFVFFVLLYAAFFAVYVVKAVVQYFSGFDTLYVLTTIKTAITYEGYVASLVCVTIAHLILSFFALFINFNLRRDSFSQEVLLIDDGRIKIILLILVVFILFSSIVMLNYGVAVMGSDGVSLPYKLSGIFYYTRTIIIPMILLMVIQQSLCFGQKQNLKMTFFVFVLLAISEIVVRASKAPLFILAAQLVIMYTLLAASQYTLKIGLRRKYVLILVIASLVLWPFIEVYRSFVVGHAVSVELFVDSFDYSDENVVLYSMMRLFQRLLGFLQLSGLLSDGAMYHDLGNILAYDSIGRYYTQEYLGLNQIGHLSSPSLLGASIMLGGDAWFVIYAFYLFITWIIWRYSLLFGYLAIPIRCFVGVGLINTIMAGTIDFFFADVLMLLAFSLFVHVGVKTLGTRRYNQNV